MHTYAPLSQTGLVIEIRLAAAGRDGEPFSWVMQVPDLPTAAAMELQLRSLGIKVELPPDPLTMGEGDGLASPEARTGSEVQR